jgi:NAD(P)-dependent dehydrogenase (short-subunit alcohol dehydrogenase family)
VTFDLGLQGRRALVMGGTKGIGAATVDILRDAGAKIVAPARSTPQIALGDVKYVAADLSTAGGCGIAVRGVIEHLGGIDIIVHVA